MKLFLNENSRIQLGASSSLQELRNNLLNALLVGMTAFGTAIYALGMIPVLEHKMPHYPEFYSALYIWFILITFVKRIPAVLRTGSMLLLFYILGAINLYVSGFNLNAAVFLIGFVVMTSLFLGARSGLAAFFVSVVSIAVTGFYVVTRGFALPLDLPQSDPVLWVIGANAFAFMTTVLIFTLYELVYGLELNLARSVSLGKELQQSNKILSESETRYRTLVEMFPDLVALLDLDGNILMANRLGLEMFGYELAQEVIGKNMLMFISPENHQDALDAFQKILESGNNREVQLLAIRQDGGIFWAEFSSALIMDAAQKPQAILVVGKDIAERKKTEQILQTSRDELADQVKIGAIEIQRSNERLRELLDRTPAIIYAASLNENYPATFYSENVREQLGYSPQEFTEDPLFWVSRLHPQDKDRVLVEVGMALKRGKMTSEYRFRRKDGAFRWMRDMAHIAYGIDGKPSEMVGSWIDITDRKQIEEELRNAKNLLDQTFASLDQAVFVVSDTDRIILACNPAAERIFGYALSEITGRSIEFMYPDHSAHADRSPLLDPELNANGVYRAEQKLRRKDGTLFPVEITETEILDEHKRRTAIVIVIRDIAERKQTEELLQESRSLYESLVNVLPHSLYRIDLMGRLTFVNKALLSNLPGSLEDIVGKTAYDFYPEELARKYRQDDERVIQTGAILAQVEENISPITGESSFVEVTKIPIYDVKGDVSGIQGVFWDITKQIKAYEALAESEKRYRTLAEAAHDVIFIVDHDNMIQYINEFGASLFGQSADRLIGQRYEKIFSSEDMAAQALSLQGAFENGESQYIESEFDNSGQLRYLSTWLAPMKGADDKIVAVMGVTRDITLLKSTEQSLKSANELLETRVAERTAELFKSEEQLRILARRLVTIQEDERRRVARELHDEAGQALIGLRLSLDMIEKEVPPGLRKLHRKINEEMRRVDQTIEQVRHLAYSLRPPILDLMGIDLGIKGLCQEFSEQTGIKVAYEGAHLTGVSEELTICLYRFVQEALTNVAKHARARKVDVTLTHADGQIVLSVKDNGRGADQASLVKGIGIQGMEERIGFVGGRLDVQFVPRKGACLKAIVPWNENRVPADEERVLL